MKKMLAITLFMLATFAWAAAQQPVTPGQDPAQSSAQPGAPTPTVTAPVTEGCLGGTDPNYTLTDKAGTTYKLNIPPTADTSKLAAHVGESVAVAGGVKGSGTSSAAIDVQGIGKGTGTCPGSGSKAAPPPTPKQ
jgi:hypothetical protein